MRRQFKFMTNDTMKERLRISEKALEGAMNYVEYRTLVNELLERNLVTGREQSNSYLNYTRLNKQRMDRWDKHFVPDEEMTQMVKGFIQKRIWLILTEGWCGDASQSIPAIEKISALNTHIHTLYLLRDDNDDIMQQFLTNGTRSIPKVICLDENNNILWHWGPRPAAATQLLDEAKVEGLNPGERKERLHLWYARNKQADLQKELKELILSERN